LLGNQVFEMSHQAGIKACPELISFFATSKDTHIRLMKIGIKDEQLVLEDSAPPNGTWDQDWDALILPQLEDKQPAYFMFRLDEQSGTGYQWVYISYSPDHSPVRQKMLYAATKATLRNEFGSGQIKDELFGTVPHDVNLAGYKRHVVSEHAPKPLTFAEEELEMIKKNEVHVEISVDSKHQTVQGVTFPLTKSALEQLKNLKSGRVNYVQLSLDLKEEIVNLELSEDIDANQLRSKIPHDHARYHFFVFKHTHEGDQLNSCVFLYTMPGYNCSIKERMLYSTCKGPLLDQVEKDIGLEIVRKLEIDDAKEVSSEFLYNEVHPMKNIAKKQFDKPRGPAGRGPKRMTKPGDGED
jgi:twinfilin-like protein